ncbi:MAG: two-component regulator propeller domain-containing protein [Candidatus Pedobacter colombiensis]|uniref:histidine kinase n=1 Tax=Candidatus Pedobacter colombiensis TaxID=3121371 RepID=A0AAJ6B750_9SPHI|nr:hybrid sensor histidine kinase/response regulator transcription factor [Pedobacter sp.]WEK19534.1 MAG: two-component regulator propeller domain-containing protein [Pedobacter sp.]
MSKVFTCLVIFLAFSISTCLSQTTPPAIKYLGIEDGLSNNVVNSLYIDHFGFVWMGTYDGLNRYDGYNFKVFRNNWAGDNSLINNHITVLNGDDLNRIWVGTQKGISYYSYADSRFHKLIYLENGKKHTLFAAVNAIAINSSSDVFVATDDGLFVLNKGQVNAERISLVKNKIPGVKAICTDDNGKLWLFVKDHGLCLFDTTSKKIKWIRTDLKNITYLLNDHGKLLWIGTEKGLLQYDKTTNSLSQSEGYPEHDNIMNLMLDKQQKLWISTDGGGVVVYDTKSKYADRLPVGKEKGFLSSNSAAQVYEDKESRKWIATLRGGINIIDQQSTQFQSIKKDPLKSNSLVNNFVLSFGEDEHKNVWIGTDGGGLSVWNRKKNTFINYVKTNNPGSLKSNFVTSILNDADNNIWVASFSGGIDRFDKQNGGFVHYSCYNEMKGAEEVNLWKLYQDRNKNIWAGTTRGGALYKYNKQKDKFELFDASLQDIHTLFQDSKGQLWGGNYTDLIRIDVLNKKHQFIKVNFAVRAIVEDAKQNLWIGTEGGGLIQYNPVTGKTKRYLQKDGLPSNSVLNILRDRKDNLWCSTYNGLSKFNICEDKFKNYYTSDGLSSNQFNYNASLKLSDGTFLFGGIDGFNFFHPDSIKENKRIPKIVLTDFRINNIPLDQDSHYRNVSVVNLNKIAIPHNAAVISVNYAAIEFSFQDQISYAYYLEGWDRDWNYVNKLNTIYYSRLNEGNYKLHIKSTDTEGAWSNNEKIIAIRILPPWYRSWWAYCIYALFFSAVYYIFQAYRSKQRNLKHEVEIANLKMEREKDLNERKLNFFTNISHELRTPLTLIVNPIKDILNIKEQGQEKNDLNVVYRNSRRLLSLVDQLLLFRKTESENDVLNVVKINLFKFAHEIFLCFSYLAKQNNIAYQFECEDEELNIYGDRDKLEITFFNLLSNALKFTSKGGFVKFKISKLGEQVKIEVSDSGPGIPEGVGEKLFDKFYKVSGNESLKMGFGIGLYLVKNFVELHHGKISFLSNEPAGTTFLIEMPVGVADGLMENNVSDKELIYVNELMPDEEQEDEKNDHVGNLELLISDLHTILVIDDNTEIIDYIRQIFQDRFKIYKATDGLDGLRKCIAFLPDIVISDINMEGLNGIELCRQVKEDPALNHIPVILLTADPSPEVKLKGTEAGAYDFVTKPFDKELFTAKINGIIKNRANLQSYFYNEITLKSDTDKVSQEDKGFLQKCVTIIEDNLTEDQFSVKTLASDLGMSHSNLYKRIKSTSGQSVNGFVRFIRLRKAAELLINTNLNINEAACRVGINDIKYFREQFQKLFKLTPSEFVKKHRKTFHKYYNINSRVLEN